MPSARPHCHSELAGPSSCAGDDDARFGWGKRPYSWEFSLSAQHELSKGVSIYGGYFRRWFGNFLVTDDLNHAASDYETFSITPGCIPAPRRIGRRRDAAGRHLHRSVLSRRSRGTAGRSAQLRRASPISCSRAAT